MSNRIKLSNSEQSEIVQKASLVFVIRVIGYLCGFVFFWLVANKFGPKTQGIFSIGFLFLSVGAMISKLGIETALVKWIASSNSIGTEKFIFHKSCTIVLFSSLLIALILFLLAPLIAMMYNKPDTELTIKIAAISIPFLSLLEVASNLFKGRKKTTTYGLFYHFFKFLGPLICLAFFYFNGSYGYDKPMISYLLGLSMVTLIIFIVTESSFKDIKKTINSTFSTKKMLMTSYPMLISSSIIMIMGWSDVFILGFFVSEEQIGVYSTAIKLAAIVSFAYNAIATIAAPKIALFFSQNKNRDLKETISFSSKLMLITGVPTFSVLFLFPEFFLMIFGEEYTNGKSVLRILLLAQLANVLTGPVGPILNMTGKQNQLKKFIIISLIFNIVFSLILVKNYQLEGVAIGSAIGMVLWNLLGALYIFKNMDIRTWTSIKKE